MVAVLGCPHGTTGAGMLVVSYGDGLTTCDTTVYLSSGRGFEGEKLNEPDLDEGRPTCSWSGCRREADTRGFYGGKMTRLCQLHKAMSDRRLAAPGRRR